MMKYIIVRYAENDIYCLNGLVIAADISAGVIYIYLFVNKY